MFSKKPKIDAANKLAPIPVKPSGTGKGISMLSNGCHFEGKVIMKGESRIGGTILGSLVSDSFLFLEPSSKISGEIIGANIVLNGLVEGDVSASELLRLSPSAVVHGNINAKRLIVEDGAKISGTVNSFSENNKNDKIKIVS